MFVDPSPVLVLIAFLEARFGVLNTLHGECGGSHFFIEGMVVCLLDR